MKPTFEPRNLSIGDRALFEHNGVLVSAKIKKKWIDPGRFVPEEGPPGWRPYDPLMDHTREADVSTVSPEDTPMFTFTLYDRHGRAISKWYSYYELLDPALFNDDADVSNATYKLRDPVFAWCSTTKLWYPAKISKQHGE